jgi:carbon-monoxide dehydrogenase medium subunit
VALFEVDRPAVLEEALDLLDPEDIAVRPIAGGTALMLRIRAAEISARRLVSLRRLRPQLAGIEVRGNGCLSIGALTTHSEIEHSELVRDRCPVLAQALRILANVRVRNEATLGGNLALADPHMDVPGVLVALGARVRAASQRGVRWLDLADLASGAFATVLTRDELLVEVEVPAQPQRAAYAKCTSLSSGHDWPAVGIAVVFDLADGSLDAPRVAVCGAEDRPRRLTDVEALLSEQEPSLELVKAAQEAAAAEADPVSDVRGSAPFKRELVRAYTGRALTSALNAERSAVTL